MPIDDNVVKMPDRLERRAQKIEAAMTRREAGDREWIEGTIELAVELAGARDDCGDDNNKFGDWLKGRFGSNRLPKTERSILIQWGKDPTMLRSVLEATESRSIQGIYQTLPSSRKGEEVGVPSSRKTPFGGPKLQEAKDKILAYEAVEGKLPPADRHFQIDGVTPSTYDRAIREVRGARAQAEVLGPLKPSKTTAIHIEAIIARRLRELEKGFSERVRLQVLEENDPYREHLRQAKEEASKEKNRYESLNNDFKPIFNETEFITILTCLHPDNSASVEKRNTAFRAFNAMKFQLTGKR